MNLDVSLTDILTSIDKVSKTFDHKKCEKAFIKKYSFLQHYTYLGCDIKKFTINVGDLIRYSKSPKHKLSCLGLIVKIKYTYDNRIDYIILTSFHKNTYWKLVLNGNPYFIFSYIRGLSKYKYQAHRKGLSTKEIIENILKDNGKLDLDFKKLIQVDPSIKNKIQWNDPLAETIDDIDNILSHSMSPTT